jgi:hypothetical protein
MINSNLIIKAIQKIYPSLEGRYTYNSGETNFTEALRWESLEFAKPTWEEIEPLLPEIELEEAKKNKENQIEEIYLRENLRPHFFDGLVLRGPGTGTIKKFKFSLDFVNQKIPALEPDRYLKTSCITQRPLAYATVDDKNNKIVVRIKPNEALAILNHVITRFENNFTIYSIILTDIENCKKIEDLNKIFWDPKLATFEMMIRTTKLMNL